MKRFIKQCASAGKDQSRQNIAVHNLLHLADIDIIHHTKAYSYLYLVVTDVNIESAMT